MSVEGRAVVVTGAGGFIGSHLAETLVRAGARVRALGHYRGDGTAGFLDDSPLRDEMEVVLGDVRDPSQMRALVRGQDLVFHLAALIGIPYSYEAPSSYVATNVSGTLHMLEACRDEGVERLLVTSTSEVYGTAHYVPIDEEHPLQGQSPYSATKIGADKLAEAYHASFSLPVVVVRPFNTYGPRQSTRAVIPTIIGQALAGGEIRIGSLDPVRDLTYVQDTVEGFLALSSAAGVDGRAVNLGCGSSVSIGELVRRICAICGREDAEVVVDPGRVRPEQSEVMELRSDNRLARELAGWNPRVDLDEGLLRTVKWFEEVGIRDPGRYRR